MPNDDDMAGAGRRASLFKARPVRIGAFAVLGALACLLGVYGSGVPAQGQSEERIARAGSDDGDTGVRDCIAYQQIDRTQVVDDDTILFRMRGRNNPIYVNELPNKCPELRSEDRFMYRTSTSQLCAVDTITVLNDVGFGFMPGATCGLGKFTPIDEDAADQLLSNARSDRDRN